MPGVTSRRQRRSRKPLQCLCRCTVLHLFNQPKLHALICHAWQYAKASGNQVLWCLAQDWPLTAEEDALTVEQLQQQREAWLLAHDQRTNGIMGLLPLVHDMPVRFTDSVCPEMKMHKNTPGRLKGIVLDSETATSVQSGGESEIALAKMPLALHVQVKGVDDRLFTFELHPE